MFITDKHSLFGYDPESVEEVIKQARENFEQRILQLEEELKNIDKDIEKVNDQLIELRTRENASPSDNSAEDKIASDLLDAHLGATQKIIIAQQEAERLVQDKKAKIMFYQKKNEELKETIEDLIRRLRSMV